MSVSEKTQAKAAEYLLSGRVKVQRLSVKGDWAAERGEEEKFAHHFLAHVMSASQAPGDPYIVRHNFHGWQCDCPARVPVCAHILACQTITDFPPVEAAGMVEFPRDPDLDALLKDL